jgi:hypothetical protein
MLNSEESFIHEQHNHGSGPFIGRDNYGSIRYEALDAKTRAVIAKLSKDAPALASLLEKALRDGVISPRAVLALESAVRNINEDVANSLMLAGRNINEDVANSLRFAGTRINVDVADRISYAAKDLATAAEQVYGFEGQRNLHEITEAANAIKDATANMIAAASEQTEWAATPSSSLRADWRTRFRVFLWGAALGFLAGVLAIYQLKH